MRNFIIILGFYAIAMSVSAYELNGHFRSRPPAMIVESQTVSGPVHDAIVQALAIAGHTVKWTVVPWKRTQKMAEHGLVDFLPRHSMNEERAKFLLPILMGYRKREVLFVVAPGKQIKVQHFSDLQGHVIGQRRGSFYAPLYNDANNLLKLSVNSYEQLLQMLEIGRVDLAIVLSDNIEFKERLLAIPGATLADFRITLLAGRYSSIPINSPAAEFYEQINAAFFNMRKSGEMDAIFKLHGLPPLHQDFTTPESKAQEAMLKQ
ncbi:substrate-binding periplasmic protein [Motilimonas eburnea]|uniref:substrate-binding periplasmic protein n=1 Tax=Motilimonas eburnea TaxID=1737488 RepID=UPI001E64932A|nr:transporter substrate-binding domain-containing protein [Motilimonas eburnea]MCE2571878.1 transporter substrate-binding domain-containing protein [Motilimonas eburnea]